MAQRIPIYIPTYINSPEYTPARVLPRLFFYNGMIDCETYWIESGSATFGGVTYQQNAFPYFDNYNVVTGSFPTTDSLSLLFNNENASYGQIPNNSLYTTYWETYISLLYNPYTRLVNASAIIPLADYFKMELNDIVNFKGNYYHLRAINDYSIKTGECNIQLLGPLGSNEFSSDFINTPRTTTTAAPTTTTTTISGSTTTTTLATTTTTAGTTTTTTFGPSTKVVAHNCQDYYDFNTYCVQASSTPAIGDVYRDSFGTCYTISSIPSDQTLPCVGNLYLVGGIGSCSSSACVTTTTTEAPFCRTWLVENDTDAGYYFKYVYCGQNEFTYLEVDPNDSATVCVQNNKIFNSFLAPLTFTNLGVDCIGTTTTTTTIAPQVLFTAANCRDIYDFNTYSANSASYNVGDVFRDDFGNCYYILNFSGEASVGRLTFVGASGSCSSSACVTTTTTAAPFCNTWLVENPYPAGYYYKVKYCGSNFYSYPEMPPFSSASICVQNNQIENVFGGVFLTNLSQSCLATTTTTLAPGCSTFVIQNRGTFFGFSGQYVYCGSSVSSSYGVGTGQTITLCVQDGKIDLPPNDPNYVVTISGSCNATTTTTTTLAPGCYLATITNNNTGVTFLGEYVGCGEFVSQSYSISSGTTEQFCTQDKKIDLPSGPNYTSSFSAVGGCTTTTTTTTTLPPAFTNIWTADGWFDRAGFTFQVDYTGSNGLFTSSIISS
jgi:hypothetical protein